MNGRAREILLTIFLGGGLRIVYEPVSREVREYFGKAVAAQSGAGLHTSAGVCHISYDEIYMMWRYYLSEVVLRCDL